MCLCHLQSLFLALEDGAAGVSVEQQVSPRYAEPLPSELEAELSEPRLPPSELLPALHDLMRGQLTEASWPAEASLKMYLGFAAEQELEDAEWWPLFPEGLQLRHALADGRVRRATRAAAQQPAARPTASERRLELRAFGRQLLTLLG